ncbi:GTP-binding protein [Tahibacter amnicola]|uniref:GTP-binding protein n=1 Tax=Tahibacter amnicola TaxID=2976241 RepID=A0ABY6BBK6_9GAMM|nr:GTP-binding protein [Tahibacter amnicola]UXI67428.1 GTP-binding protein [Tahibacter amnicola]
MNTADTEFKIVFTGPMGAGKTTAIGAISDDAPVSTEVANTDEYAYDKALTTCGLDYGFIALDDGRGARLYGTPGQVRFRFMWDILSRNATGIVLLLDAAQSDALSQLEFFLDHFGSDRLTPIIVGVGRTGQSGAHPLGAFSELLERRGRVIPVFSVDVRQRSDVILLIDALLCVIELSERLRRSA